ncbi:hypothetical protein [Flexithrix dorotheae]|uniref:hypothetical protein n=1 Tax=Flexithrix dorotheae TaxID=70993 RepID=UPI00036EF3F2|nr:hypothetical protein [Flexithrix dorotheae]
MKTLKKIGIVALATMVSFSVMADPGTGNDSKNKKNETTVMTYQQSSSPLANNYKFNKSFSNEKELATPVVSAPTSNNFKENNHKLNKNKSNSTEEGKAIVTQHEEQRSFTVYKGQKHSKSKGRVN